MMPELLTLVAEICALWVAANIYILTIEKRSRNSVFKIADKRNRSFKQIKNSARDKYLSNTPKWSDKKKSTKKKKRTDENDDTSNDGRAEKSR